ncbi:hypothetical protein OGAPHI_006953 [Ogataea philodendri]|uniref:Uncharacterized protein n=1 Tax=Ogataea philodendri TaxID=1378263 RepID=A0A9P8NVV2_9ASCO|nr:uncharacterized protein OGAPHI_006953 [Ogataea philodendri]KAH3660367.1 hypothetical protein OGAPHI_006953 [Ogataea philodendri]
MVFAANQVRAWIQSGQPLSHRGDMLVGHSLVDEVLVSQGVGESRSNKRNTEIRRLNTIHGLQRFVNHSQLAMTMTQSHQIEIVVVVRVKQLLPVSLWKISYKERMHDLRSSSKFFLLDHSATIIDQTMLTPTSKHLSLRCKHNKRICCTRLYSELTMNNGWKPLYLPTPNLLNSDIDACCPKFPQIVSSKVAVRVRISPVSRKQHFRGISNRCSNDDVCAIPQ